MAELDRLGEFLLRAARGHCRFSGCAWGVSYCGIFQAVLGGAQAWGQEDALSGCCTWAGGLEINISESSNFFGHLHDPSPVRGLEMDGLAAGGVAGIVPRRN